MVKTLDEAFGTLRKIPDQFWGQSLSNEGDPNYRNYVSGSATVLSTAIQAISDAFEISVEVQAPKDASKNVKDIASEAIENTGQRLLLVVSFILSLDVKHASDTVIVSIHVRERRIGPHPPDAHAHFVQATRLVSLQRFPDSNRRCSWAWPVSRISSRVKSYVRGTIPTNTMADTCHYNILFPGSHTNASSSSTTSVHQTLRDRRTETGRSATRTRPNIETSPSVPPYVRTRSTFASGFETISCHQTGYHDGESYSCGTAAWRSGGRAVQPPGASPAQKGCGRGGLQF